MDHGSQLKSQLVSVTFARELLCLRAGSMLNITWQWEDPEISLFFVIRVYYDFFICDMTADAIVKIIIW